MAGRTVAASDAHVVTPTFVPDLVRVCLDLAIDGECGLWHLTNQQPVSWHAFGQRIATALGLDPAGLIPATADALGWRAERPRQAALSSSRGALLPSLDEAIAKHAAERLRHRQPVEAVPG